MGAILSYNENHKHLMNLIEKWMHSGYKEEALEFLNACKRDCASVHDSIGELEENIEELEKKIDDLEDEARELQENFVDFELFEKVNVGIGNIEYRTDNLQLQSKMDDFIIQLKN